LARGKRTFLNAGTDNNSTVRVKALPQIRSHVSLGALKQILITPHLLKRIPKYLLQLRSYRKLEFAATGQNAKLRLYPCLDDNSQVQSAHSYYFYQDCWAARQVFRESPEWLVDLGSTMLLVGVLSQFVKCVSVDYRPIQADLAGLHPVCGTLLNLPFLDNSIPCVTSMCVLEHVGLGRYGDPLSPLGTKQAVAEISRVVAPGGIVVYSVPAGCDLNEFNAHRRFSYAQAAAFFEGWQLVDSCVLTPSPVPLGQNQSFDEVADPVVCFCFRKPS
jgi:SAM-dependent methyltransferase